MLLRAVLVYGVFVLFLTGCQTSSEIHQSRFEAIKLWKINFDAEGYPADWPSLSTLGPQCQMIRGKFLARGLLSGSDNSNASSLLGVLEIQTPEKDLDQVELDISTLWSDNSGDTASSLLVKHGNSIQPAFSHPNADFSNCFCLNQILYCTHSYGGAMAPAPIGAFGEVSLFFMRAQDGSLVIQKQDTLIGIVVIVPFYTSSKEWMRFPSAENKSPE